MVWPFTRGGRGKRLSGLGQPATLDSDDLSEKAFDPNNPRNATPRSARRNPEESSLRKRRRSPDFPLEKEPLPDQSRTAEPRRHRSRASVENITALPGARRLETSPHLRCSDTYRTAIPYSSTTAPASRVAQMAGQEKPNRRADTQKRRLSKRQEYHTRALREEEIRAMSAPVPIPKRDAANGDLLARENKKARRTFSAKAGDDRRASIVSLPFQESIHSSMSGGSESRGWEIPKLNLFSPRPSVRLSSSLGHATNGGLNSALHRTGSKKDRLPALQEGVKRRDRRRMAELADDLDASDLRTLMERDNRRKDKKKLADKEKLEAKLRRRASSRASRTRTREREPPVPPVAIHPAFRQSPPFESSPSHAAAPSTPAPGIEQRDTDLQATALPDQVASSPSPFADPTKDSYNLDSQREDSPQSPEEPTPVETPLEDPVLATAEEVRYSHGRLSQICPSPPASPTRLSHPRNMSPLRRELTPDLTVQTGPSPLRHSESSATKKAGSWASIFRRSGTTRAEVLPAPRAGTSFSNTSRDSMSKQPIPAHLVATAPRRSSGTPARTQSIFREDLPESPSSLPDSRVNSPDIIATARIAAARRSKRASSAVVGNQGLGPTRESSTRSRSKSPAADNEADNDEHGSAAAMSASLASVDSEGSWLTGRPSKRKSGQSHMRNSIGSASRRRASDNPSFEELAVPDDELVRRLTPSPEDDAKEREEESVTPAADTPPDDSLPLRRDTSRRKPNLVLRDEVAVSREGLVAELSSKESGSDGSPGPSTLDSESEFDQFRNGLEEHVVYGRGHARHLSSGSAKLLEIPSRNRSGRTTPDARKSLAHSPDLSGKFPTGLQSPPLSPTQTHV